MSRWDDHVGQVGPLWLLDKLGNVLGYRNRVGSDFQIAAQALPAGAESLLPGALLSPGGAGSLFTSTSNGLTPASGGGTTAYLRADGSWQVPPVSTALFTSSTNGIVPSSGGGTVNYLRADGSWSTPPIGPTYSVFGSSAIGLVPASGGGTTNFLRADGTFSTPPGSNYSIFGSATAGLVPASGGGTVTYLRADGTFNVPPGTTYSNFTAVAAGLVPASGGGTVTYLRADGTWVTPTGSGDMVLAGVQTITGAKTFSDDKLILAGFTSGTTTLKATAVAGTTTWTFPASNDTVVGLGATQTLTNKTLTTPTIASILNGAATLTLPTTSDTIVGRGTTDTLTNKTISGGTISATTVGITRPFSTSDTTMATTEFVAILGAGKASTAIFTSAVNGIVPASGGGTTAYLRADGSWTVPPVGSGLTDATSIAYPTTHIWPFDTTGFGKRMASYTLTANIAPTLGAGSVEGGGLEGIFQQGTAAYTITFPTTWIKQGTVTLGTTNGDRVKFTGEFTGGNVIYTLITLSVADIIAPVVNSRTVENALPGRLVKVFSEPMDQTVAPTLANYSMSGGHTISAWTWSSSTSGYFTFSPAMVFGDSRTISYTGTTNKIKDLAGNFLADYTTQSITNNVLATVANPPTVLAVSGTPGSTSIVFTFTASVVDATHSAATGYRIESRPTGSGSYTSRGTSSASPITATGLTASTAYDFRCIATNSAGDSAPSNVIVNQSTAASSAQLTYTTPAVATKDLTALNYADYYVYTPTEVTKSGATAISPYTYENAEYTPGTSFSHAYSWTDGTPTASGSSTSTMRISPIVPANMSAAYWTVPADTTTRKVLIAVACYSNTDPTGIQVRLKLSLSDNSVTALNLAIPATLFEAISTVYEVTYRAGINGQTLTIRLEKPGGSTLSNDILAIAYNNP